MSALFNLTSDLYKAQDEEIGISNRSKYVEVLVAKSIAFSLPMPATMPEDPKLYFIDTFMSEARRKISAFNEEYPINIQSTYDLTVTMYVSRCHLVYSPEMINPTSLLIYLKDQPAFIYNVEPRYLDLPAIELSPVAKAKVDSFLINV